MPVSSQQKVAGFTLIESLVALLVLSFGVLALTAIQMKSMQSSHAAYQRSMATIAAQDLVERLWVEMADNPPLCPNGTELTAVVDAWHQEWSPDLPSLVKAGTVVRTGCDYVITVDWSDERFQGEEVSEFAYEASLIGDAP
ncbi:type IV pilus modification protein PilV [Halomonas organivorans]